MLRSPSNIVRPETYFGWSKLFANKWGHCFLNVSSSSISHSSSSWPTCPAERPLWHQMTTMNVPFHSPLKSYQKILNDRDRTRTCNPQIRSLVHYPLGNTAGDMEILLALLVVVWYNNLGCNNTILMNVFLRSFPVLASAVHILKLERYRED